MKLADRPLTLREKSPCLPLVIGGMGVDISTPELACVAAHYGAIGHISDAMVQLVSDRRCGLNLSQKKAERFSSSRALSTKPEVKFDAHDLALAQRSLVERTMNEKRGSGLIFINIMEKLSMGAPNETLAIRLRSALDGGIDGITLSAGLHTGSLAMIQDHPRFRDALIGIIVSSARALKIFLRSAARADRMPDYVVVEGPLAGGHLGFGEDWRTHNLHDIVRDVLALLREQQLTIPVIPAGGIFTGADALTFIAEGASGVQVATRFAVTRESGLPDAVKQEYFRAEESDVVVNSVSPTGYLMRMLKQSPCLSSNVRPACEPFGYMLSREGQCAYLDAYRSTGLDAAGRKLPVREKICLCHHFSRAGCYTCGQNVYRLKERTRKLEDGSYEVPTAESVLADYLEHDEEVIC